MIIVLNLFFWAAVLFVLICIVCWVGSTKAQRRREREGRQFAAWVCGILAFFSLLISYLMWDHISGVNKSRRQDHLRWVAFDRRYHVGVNSFTPWQHRPRDGDGAHEHYANVLFSTATQSCRGHYQRIGNDNYLLTSTVTCGPLPSSPSSPQVIDETNNKIHPEGR